MFDDLSKEINRWFVFVFVFCFIFVEYQDRDTYVWGHWCMCVCCVGTYCLFVCINESTWLCVHTHTYTHTHDNASRTVLDSPSDDMFWWFCKLCILYLIFAALFSRNKKSCSPSLFYSVLRDHHYLIFYIHVNGFVFWVSIKLCISSSKSSPNCKFRETIQN